MSVIDIHSKGPEPGCKLSNFYPHAFIFDSVRCGSMEGFLQSLKFFDRSEQDKVCGMVGYTAKRYAMEYAPDWRVPQTLWWNRHPYARDGWGYQALLRAAFQALYDQNTEFRNSLNSTGDEELTHSVGRDSKKESILTAKEFVTILTEMRTQKDSQKVLTLIS